MYKILLVDDDKLVRKGLIATMPWRDYDFEIIGEANNGEKALEFLKHHEVDILITDLAMPIMSGIELMEAVSSTYPGLWMVVLTFHQDFEWIQTALRLGAIDYIAKVQLEFEQSDAVLERIRNRIRLEEEKRTGSSKSVRHDLEQRISSKSECLVLYALNDTFLPTSIQNEEAFVELQERLWFIDEEDNDEDKIREKLTRMLSMEQKQQLDHQEQGEHDRQAERKVQQAVVLQMTGWHEISLEALSKCVQSYIQQTFFYEYEAGKVVYEVDVEKAKQQIRPVWDEQQWETIQEQWRSLLWVVQDDYFRSYIAELVQARPPAHKLESLFYTAKHEWVRIVGEDAFADQPSFGSLRYWQDWEEWIYKARSIIKHKIHKASYSEEISGSILQAVEYITLHPELEIRIDDLAKKVNMSRSYFSQCFKDIVGLPAIDYIKKIRISNAQSLLLQTTNPIYWVAQQCGYPDEKYFSKVFQEFVGMPPSKYRKEYAKDDNHLKKG